MDFKVEPGTKTGQEDGRWRMYVRRNKRAHVLWGIVGALLLTYCTLRFRPCVSCDAVDLRIIVITQNRVKSTLKLLQSLERLELDGDTAALEVWIDRSKKGEQVDDDMVRAATDFTWSKGRKQVHVQARHVGIYGQWIDTWRPRDGELALILEDDISVSPYAWRWIKAAHRKFGARDDILGYTLQSQGVRFAVGGGGLQADPKLNVYLNRQMGSWGFAPHPKVWAQFQDWFHTVYRDPSFKPYVGGGVVFDQWYKGFERQGTQDGMWTIWFIHYTNKHNLYCVYNNLDAFTGSKDHKLGVHRAEPGLHHSGTAKDNEHELLTDWQDTFVDFPPKVPKYEFNGTITWVDV